MPIFILSLGIIGILGFLGVYSRLSPKTKKRILFPL